MIGGFEEPDEGAIYLGDRDVVGLPPYRRDVNTVFQSYALFPHLSIFDNVAFGLRRKGVDKAQVKGRVDEMLRLVGLEGLGARRPRQLSGGQQQRVALARALVNRPQVLLLDEPLGALDLKLRKQMQLELKAIQHDLGLTFVHVTHDQEEAMTMADAIAVMNHGRIEQLGPPTELYEQPRDRLRRRLPRRLEPARRLGHGAGPVRLDTGDEIAADAGDRAGRVAVGIRPEKIRLGPPGEGDNSLAGTVKETAYVGVATQYVVETGAGTLIVYVQNDGAGPPLQPGAAATLSWSPHATFVVDPHRRKPHDPSADPP